MESKLSIEQLIKNVEGHWPKFATGKCNVALSLIRLHELMMEEASARLDKFDLSQAGFEVLVTLRALPLPNMLTPTDLYRSILITSGGMTKVLKHLEARNCIERVNNPEDKRSKFVKLTDTGKDLIEKAMTEVAQGDDLFFGNAFKDGELEKVEHLLRKALIRLEK